MAVVESKFMWLGKDGKIHYISKEQFNKAIEIANKTVDVGIKTIVFTGLSAVTGGHVFAADGNTVMEGLQPLIELITDFAEPVAYGYMVKGFLKYAQGEEETGKKILTDAGAGYLGVKFIPQIMRFLGGLDLFV